MDRKKAPALTSPWKIGFFVSLLLVAMSIGVGFLITRAFNISWTWVEYGGTNWQNWVFHTDAFMNEMLPLVLLVPILSQLSFFMIAGAVRKYKAYVDSGADYKNLVHKLEQIEDLNDDKAIKKLGNYPELRDFLRGLKDSVAQREADLDRREHEVEKKGGSESNDSLSQETAILLDAIANARTDGFKEPLALTIPDLKKLETAISDTLVSDAPQSLAASAPVDNGLEEKLQAIEHEVRDIASMLDADITEACQQFDETRETAEQVRAMAEQLAATASPGAANSAAAMMDAFKVLDVISQSLKTLGEDAKGVAINTALQAGQQASVPSSEVVALADDVKNIAARFAAITAEWDTVAATTRAAIGGNNAEGEVSPEGKALTDTLQNWIDGSTAFAEKLRALHTQQNEAFGELNAAWQGGQTNYEDVASVDLDAPSAYTPQVGGEENHATDDGFERQGQAIDNAPRAEDAGAEDEFFADIPANDDDGVSAEKVKKGDTVEITPKPSPATEAVQKPEETQDANAGSAVETAEAAAEEAPEVPEAALEESPVEHPEKIELETRSSMFDHMKSTPAPEAPAPTDDGFLTDPAARSDDDVAAETPAPATESFKSEVEEQQEDVHEVDLDDDDVIDLYALGAVDYQPENLVHNS